MYVARLRTQTRTVPKSAIDRLVEETKRKIEADTGRKPGRKEIKALREDAVLELLPRAFTKDHDIFALIDPVRGLLIVSTSSTAKAGTMASALIDVHVTNETLGRNEEPLVIRPIATVNSPVDFMLRALREEASPFTALGRCSLISEDEMSRQVVYTNQTLAGSEEVARHIRAGELPVFVELALEQHTSFTLTSDFSVRGLTLHDDIVSGSTASNRDVSDDEFDANTAILGGCLVKLYDALIEGMGGMQPDRQARIDISF